MITFDESPEILKPSLMVEKPENFPETAIVTFSGKYMRLLSQKFDPSELYTLNAGFKVPVYGFSYNSKALAIFQTGIGGACAAGLLEEAIVLGAKKVLFFGSCGALDKALEGGRIAIPFQADRDEGTSYHYAPPSDYIEIKSAPRLAEIFDELGVPYIKTKTWTTDAIYRETAQKAEKRRGEGCSVVEMECASVMAAGQFRGIDVYQFLYAEDCLDGDCWDKRILGNVPADIRERIFKIALETAIRL